MLNVPQLWAFICLFLIYPEPPLTHAPGPLLVCDWDTQGDQLMKREGYYGSVCGFSLCWLTLLLQTSSETFVLIEGHSRIKTFISNKSRKRDQGTTALKDIPLVIWNFHQEGPASWSPSCNTWVLGDNLTLQHLRSALYLNGCFPWQMLFLGFVS